VKLTQDHKGRIALLGALDTKAEEVALVVRELGNVGLPVLVVDTGILGQAEVPADIDRETVARAGGKSLASLVKERHSGSSLSVMSAGAKALLEQLVASGEVVGVIGIGGSRGTVMAAGAMRDLPLGLPKIIVTPSLLGNARQIVGSSDIVFIPTVADLLGVNRITRPVLLRAVRMLVGWLNIDHDFPAGDAPTVALTSFGVTTPCVAQVRHLLAERGHDVVVFPANGFGGPAMERMAEQGLVQGIIDVTTHEMVDTMLGGMCATKEPRLGRKSLSEIPRVVSAGALDFVNFQAGQVPERYADRLLYQHSSAVTLMRTDAEECRTVGQSVAAALVASDGPFSVVVPSGGFSEYDRPGGPFWLPSADIACMDAIRDGVESRGRFLKENLNINEASFARLLVEEYAALARI
jgi:uncharacterized protein (UPF0261 family)